MSLLKIHIVKIRGIFCIKYQEKLALFNKVDLDLVYGVTPGENNTDIG